MAKTAHSVRDTISLLFSSILPSERKKIPPDKGLEFAYYEEFQKTNKVLAFFADPSSSWRRGSNENTNGSVREYLPKRTDFIDIPKEYIDLYTEKINHRPRKCLGWKIPFKMFYNKVLRLI